MHWLVLVYGKKNLPKVLHSRTEPATIYLQSELLNSAAMSAAVKKSRFSFVLLEKCFYRVSTVETEKRVMC